MAVSGFTILATSSRACLPRRFPSSARDRRSRRVRKCERSRKLESWRRSRDSRRPADAALDLPLESRPYRSQKHHRQHSAGTRHRARTGERWADAVAHVSHRPLGNRCCDRLLHRRGRHGRRLVTYYVLVVIELSSRKVHIAGITPCAKTRLCPVTRKKENRPEAADYGRSNLRNQRRIDFLRSTTLLNGEAENHSCARMELLTCCSDIPLFVHLNSLFFPSNSLFADFQFPVLSSGIPCYFGTGNCHLTI